MNLITLITLVNDNNFDNYLYNNHNKVFIGPLQPWGYLCADIWKHTSHAHVEFRMHVLLYHLRVVIYHKIIPYIRYIYVFIIQIHGHKNFFLLLFLLLLVVVL